MTPLVLPVTTTLCNEFVAHRTEINRPIEEQNDARTTSRAAQTKGGTASLGRIAWVRLTKGLKGIRWCGRCLSLSRLPLSLAPFGRTHF